VSRKLRLTPKPRRIGPNGTRLSSRRLLLGLLAGAVLLAGLAACSPSQPSPPARAEPAPGWSTLSSPAPGASSSLASIACPEPRSCVAVGTSSDAGSSGAQALVESWDGRSWSVAMAPHPAGNVWLNSVACPAMDRCIAVGSMNSSADPRGGRALAEMGPRPWTISPIPSPGLHAALQSITCLSAGDCVAVGSWIVSAGDLPRTLVESWDGTSWSVVPSPAPGNDSWLEAVACASTAQCVAVGSYSTNYNDMNANGSTLVESWDGRTWSVTPSPGPGIDSWLGAVACPSPDSCIATGSFNPNGDPWFPTWRTLVETWDGSAWSIAPSPSPGQQAALLAVSCGPPGSCLAAGSSSPAGTTGGSHALMESWDGQSWALVPMALRGADSSLAAVACATASICMAVGSQGRQIAGNTQPRTLAEALNGG